MIRYVWDFEKVLQEVDGGGGTVGHQYLTTDQQYGDLVSGFDGTNTRYYDFDALGSAEALLDGSGSPTEQYAYRAFGLAAQTPGSDLQPFTWVGKQGYQRDTETSLYLLGAGGASSYYDPNTAVFLRPDPLWPWTGSQSAYAYCWNDPINNNDPSGFVSCGPDVTEWFDKEINLFRDNADAIRRLMESPTPIVGQYGDGEPAIVLKALLGFKRLALLMDYKERTNTKVEPFDYSKCADPDAGTPKETVTLCGVCIQTNQLGNIMYGIIAALTGLTKEARAYANGEFLVMGPAPDFRAPGEEYRRFAFELGVDYQNEFMRSGARATSFCDYIRARGKSISKHASTKTPCIVKHKGPNTDLKRKPCVKGDGNR